MKTIKGSISKIKILKHLDNGSPLVRFNLNDINCLIAFHSLMFLFEVTENATVVVAGEYNSRNQFVVRRYCVIQKDHFAKAHTIHTDH